MAATIQASAEVTIPSSGEAAAPQRADGPRALIARLAELHDEAAETALLANLLGRVPYLAAVLLGMACATAVLVHAGIAPLLTWLTLAAAGLVALMRAYVIAITDKGKRVSEKSTELVNAVEASMFSPLTEEEQNLVRKLSARLLLHPGIIAEAHAKLARAD